jgi:hypothetical protein
MPIKIVAAVIAVALFLSYVGAILVKMKDVALGAIILIGVAMMLVDLWNSLERAED